MTYECMNPAQFFLFLDIVNTTGIDIINQQIVVTMNETIQHAYSYVGDKICHVKRLPDLITHGEALTQMYESMHEVGVLTLDGKLAQPAR